MGRSGNAGPTGEKALADIPAAAAPSASSSVLSWVSPRAGSGRASTQRGLQGRVEGGTQLGPGRRRSGGQSAYDEPAAGREAADASSDQVPELAANAVADHSAADGPRDYEASARSDSLSGDGRVGRTGREMHDQQAGPAAPGAAATSAQRRGKLAAAPQPGAGREHARQAESRERPL